MGEKGGWERREGGREGRVGERGGRERGEGLNGGGCTVDTGPSG